MSSAGQGEDGRPQKRAVLLLGPHVLWTDLQALEQALGVALGSSRQSDRRPGDARHAYQWLGVARQTRDAWVAGRGVSDDGLRDALVRLRAAVWCHKALADQRRCGGLFEPVVQRIDALLTTIDDNVSVLRFGAALGLEADDTRRRLDMAYDQAHPLFKLPYIGSARTAEKALQGLRGTHLTWLMRGDSRILQCPTRFRYVVRLQGGYVVRVKLNVPKVSATPDELNGADHARWVPPHIEYDGYVMLFQPGRIFLSFETREVGQDSDLLHAVIERYHTRDHYRTGHYLTVDQDNGQSPIAERLLMQHMPLSRVNYDDEASRTAFMRREMRVIEAGMREFSDIRRLMMAGTSAEDEG
jgi:hypothetical protein